MATSTTTLTRTFAALGLTVGAILSSPALADLARFDGTWSVHLVSSGGLCGSSASQVLTVSNGSVRGRVRVERVGPSRAGRIG